MSISPTIKKLAQQALKIKNSQVPLHRVIDILATEHGDVSEAINRFRDIQEPELRRAFHYCAQLLREIETEAGLRPAWETAPTGTSAGKPSATTGTSTGAGVSGATTKPKTSKARFSPDELKSFEDTSVRGQVRVAKVYTDGASKGNPGDSGIGVAMFTMDGRKIGQLAKAIGIGTNNQAEYAALLEALHMAKRLDVKVLNILSDSELMVKQMSGVYKIKNPDILQRTKEAMALVRGFEKVTFSYIGREHNTLADALSTMLLKKKTNPSLPALADGHELSEDVLPTLDENTDDGSTE